MFLEANPRHPARAFGAHLRRCATLKRIALVGNFLPRLCGLATYTTHVHDALRHCLPGATVDVYAMVDPGRAYAFPPAVVRTIDQEDRAAYLAAAAEIEASGADLLWLQHEFGIYGGPAGCHVLDLLRHVTMPVQVTLHTVLENPSAEQLAVMEGLIARADTLVVMAKKGREILERVYGVARSSILVIPHGVPDRPYIEPDIVKPRFGLAGHKTILTFGLLAPGKGIETMIAALPAIVADCPDALYVVLGATHPNLVAHEGERYREELKALARMLGVEHHVRFVDAFVDEDELIRWLSAADVYVTPYLNPAQITSGALAYAVGLGKPVVSTPYAHAVELLAEGHGRLVDFQDVAAIGREVSALLLDDRARSMLAQKAYRLGRRMTWDRVIGHAVDHFATALESARPTEAGTDRLLLAD
jgi:glycosyltransferase involved in cell wall biosynthesis